MFCFRNASRNWRDPGGDFVDLLSAEFDRPGFEATLALAFSRHHHDDLRLNCRRISVNHPGATDQRASDSRSGELLLLLLLLLLLPSIFFYYFSVFFLYLRLPPLLLFIILLPIPSHPIPFHPFPSHPFPSPDPFRLYVFRRRLYSPVGGADCIRHCHRQPEVARFHPAFHRRRFRRHHSPRRRASRRRHLSRHASRLAAFAKLLFHRRNDRFSIRITTGLFDVF